MADIYELYDKYKEEESPEDVMTKGDNTLMVVQNIPNPQLRVKMKTNDYLVLVAITLNQFFLAVFTSFMAIATAFMEQTELSLERIQYMYYFLFCVLNHYYVFDIWFGLMVRNDKENPPRLPGTASKRTLSTLIGISIVIITIDFFLITRFFFVTFPFIEQDPKSKDEAYFFLCAESLRLISFIVSTMILAKYRRIIEYKFKDIIQNDRKNTFFDKYVTKV